MQQQQGFKKFLQHCCDMNRSTSSAKVVTKEDMECFPRDVVNALWMVRLGISEG